jgi:hypothetical protein
MAIQLTFQSQSYPERSIKELSILSSWILSDSIFGDILVLDLLNSSLMLINLKQLHRDLFVMSGNVDLILKRIFGKLGQRKSK